MSHVWEWVLDILSGFRAEMVQEEAFLYGALAASLAILALVLVLLVLRRLVSPAFSGLVFEGERGRLVIAPAAVRRFVALSIEQCPEVALVRTRLRPNGVGVGVTVEVEAELGKFGAGLGERISSRLSADLCDKFAIPAEAVRVDVVVVGIESAVGGLDDSPASGNVTLRW